MTSTLPNFAACLATPAGPATLNSAAMAGLMSSAGIPAAAPSAVAGVPFEFASLLPASTVSAIPVPPATSSTTAGALTEGMGPLANQQVALSTETGVAPTLVFVVPGKIVLPGKTVYSTASASVAEPAPARLQGSEQPSARPHGISREEFEQAAAFVAALMQTLLPAAPAAPAPETISATAPAVTTDASEAVLPDPTASVTGPMTSPVPASPQGSPWNETSLTLPNGRDFPAHLPDQANPSLGGDRSAHGQLPMPVGTNDEVLPEQIAAPLTLPNGRDFPTGLPDQAKPSLAANRSVPEKLPVQARPMVVPGHSLPTEPVLEMDRSLDVSTAPHAEGAMDTSVQSEPVFTVAADGAIELKLSLSATGETDLKADAQPVSPLEVSAELELPGQAVIRVEATVSDAHAFSETARPVNFAGFKVAEKAGNDLPTEPVERNFLVTGDKQVKSLSPESGIAVAKTENKMSVAPTEETRNTRNPETLSALPSRADFQVVQSPTERITVASAEPAGQNFAERAVATVTGLAEAQFSASMHKAGSVQLRLKFGNEDLSVRVELRDGAVHTDFRTDSPELREALTKEWQAVAASSPGHLQRFLDPVFSPASASGSTDAGTQQHASHRQSPQQQAQEQAANRQDAWHSQSPFSRRSALSESFVPEPAAPRVPVLLPTSLRLSVLA